MENADNSFKSSINEESTTMKNNIKHSFSLNHTHKDEESSSDNENVPHLKRNTPILFSTNRGLHLRLLTTTTTFSSHTSSTSAKSTHTSKINSAYSTVFCDLERWSTNRANTISLEDTFTIPKPAVISGSLTSTSLRFLTHKATSDLIYGSIMDGNRTTVELLVAKVDNGDHKVVVTLATTNLLLPPGN